MGYSIVAYGDNIGHVITQGHDQDFKSFSQAFVFIQSPKQLSQVFEKLDSVWKTQGCFEINTNTQLNLSNTQQIFH